ncbi:MAG: VOC family protein [Acidobacteriota bacterium]|nr:VOC family protein [Acidobacteriota bacterium]
MSTAQEPPGLTTLGQIGLTVQDAGRATAFYRDVLKVPFLFEASGMAFFALGEVRLMLGEGSGDQEPHGTILYFRTEDIEAHHRELEARGVHFLQAPHLVAKMPDHELWMAFFEDGEGNTLALMSERRG